ncbi:MAG: tRNA (adenosine(37)-N6)-threonylcarbamoyltransferase complex dimerization subunit type 1 TsaB [Ferruginibacter sp.]
MSLILNIDSSLQTASVSLAKNGDILQLLQNENQQEHAAFLHTAIKNIFVKTAVDIKELDAVAVTEGPGSYTGLRVGMSAAKGLCYALQKPFITINTLEAMAKAAVFEINSEENLLLVPMIDARRMEVFTAVYNKSLQLKMPAQALVLNEDSYKDELTGSRACFFGNGAAKWKAICCHHPNADFSVEYFDLPKAIALLTYRSFTTKKFTELSLSQPLYIKEFFSNK